MKVLHTITVATLCSLLYNPCMAQELDSSRAKYNYQMFCQGCHTPEGFGAGNVPRMKGHVGHFLKSQAGREYLVRVPGSATSALDDTLLAEVLNWIVIEFAGSSGNENWDWYTAQEVSELRQHPLNEVENYRKNLLFEISQNSTKE